MSLIATNKIADYITKHPDARVPLLLWLKQQAYLSRYMFNRSNPNDYIGESYSTADPDYCITYLINNPAKAMLITRVESEKEQEERFDREFAEAKKNSSGTLRRITKIFTTTIQPPEPLEIDEVNIDNKTSAKPVIKTVIHNPIEPALVSPDFTGITPLASVVEYKHALDRATEIFKAQPGEPEYDELISLLPQIVQYEFQQLKFPALKPFEAVKHRLALFKMLPEHLHSFIDSTTAQQFLAGEVELDDDVLQEIYQFLGLRFAPDDRRFDG